MPISPSDINEFGYEGMIFPLSNAWGTIWNDIIFAYNGNGRGGDDIIHIVRPSTLDTYGGDGNDILYADRPNGSGGFLDGGNGNDTYHVDLFDYGWTGSSYTSPNAFTSIRDNSGTDTLVLDVDSTDVTLAMEGDASFTINYTHPVTGTVNYVRIDGEFTGSFGIDYIQFNDVTLSITDLPFAQKATALVPDLMGGVGGDLLLGDNNANVLDALSVDSANIYALDALYGYGGNDTLKVGNGFNRMYGGAGSDVYYVTPNLSDADVSVTWIGEKVGEGTDSVHVNIASTSITPMAMDQGNFYFTFYDGMYEAPSSNTIYVEDQYVNKHDDGTYKTKIEEFVFTDTTLSANDFHVVKFLTPLDTSYSTSADSTQQVVVGHSGNDYITINSYNEYVVYGEDGNDQIISSSAAYYRNYIFGGDGDDEISSGSGIDYLEGNDGDDIIVSNAGNDEVYGGSGNDTISGGDDLDLLYGNDGNDTISGGKGEDIIYGGSGNDTIYATSSIAPYGYIESEAVLNPAPGGGLSYRINTDTLYGEDGDDILHGDAQYGNAEMYGGTGNDTYVTSGWYDTTYTHESSHHIIYDEDGSNDQINAIGGPYVWDSIAIEHGFTRDGNNLIITNTPMPFINQPYYETVEIVDHFKRGHSIETIISGDPLTYPDVHLVEDKTSGNDTVVAGVNEIGMTDNIIRGLGGNDTIRGMVGDDLLYGNDGNDTLYGDDGASTFTIGNDQLDGGDGDDNLYGEMGNDQLWGGNGADTLSGGQHDDILYGEAGNDTLIVDSGNDILDGGSGDDTYKYFGGVATLTDASGTDTIAFGPGIKQSDLTFINMGNGAARIEISNFPLGNFIIIDGQITLPVIESLSFADGSSLNLSTFSSWVSGSSSGTSTEMYSSSTDTDAIDPSHTNEFGYEGMIFPLSNAWGTIWNDIIFAYNGNGRGGDDIIHIVRPSALDTYGGDGNDILYADRPNGSGGFLDGGNGNDTYHVDLFDYGWTGSSYTSPNAFTSIRDNSGTDTLVLDVDSTDVTLAMEGDASFTINYTHPVTGTVNYVRIDGEFTGSFGIDYIQFNDVTLSITDLPFAQKATALVPDLMGGVGGDLLLGDNNANVLDALSVDSANIYALDALYGYGGNDTLKVGNGFNRMYGGAGSDVYYVTPNLSDADVSVTWIGEKVGEGTDSVHVNIASTSITPMAMDQGNFYFTFYDGMYEAPSSNTIYVEDQYVNKHDDGTYKTKIEEFVFTDTTLSANDFHVVKFLTPLDTSYSTSADSTQQVVVGHSGNDYITINSYNEYVVYGEDGNDQIISSSAAYYRNYIFGGDGDDEISSGSGIDYLEGNDGDDIIVSNAGNDEVYGGSGNDTISGGDDLDLLYGNDGNDTISGGKGEDIIYGGSGNDTIYATSSIAPYGYIESEAVLNPAPGGGLSYRINTDTLYGEDGDDILHGDAQYGNAEMYGGTGNDTYVTSGWYDTTYTHESSHHIIYDEDGSNDQINAIGGPYVWDSIAIEHGFTRDGNNLIITNTPMPFINQPYYETVEIVDHFKRGHSIETIISGDPLTYPDVHLVEDKTSGNDTVVAGVNEIGMTDNIIRGLGGNDTIRGMVGDDLLYGNDGNDTLYGDDGASTFTIGNDQLDGGDGDDNLYGEMGNDQLWGGNGADTLSGGQHDDILYGEAGNDTLIVDSGNDILDGGSGDDTYKYFGGVATITDASGTDTIAFERGISISDLAFINLGNGDMRIDFTSFPTESFLIIKGQFTAPVIEKLVFTADSEMILDLTRFNDWIIGTNSGDTINGDIRSDKNDIILALDGNDTVYGLTANDLIYGGAGNDTVYGGSGNDFVYGQEGNDFLYGEDGNDTLSGSDGDDAINGGNGVDTVTYANSGSAITVTLATTSAQNTGGGGIDTLIDIENIVGSSHNDILTGSTANNTIEGGAGSDYIDGGSGTDTISYLSAISAVIVNLSTTTAQNTVGAGTDTLVSIENIIGSDFNDTLTGNSSSNIIEGGAGNDMMDGSSGTDTLSYVSAKSGIIINLSVTSAQNTVGSGTDTIANFENINGSAFDDTITGTTGNNIIDGGAGNDNINGGSGTDTITYVSSSVGITVNLSLTSAQNTGGAGVDTLTSIENATGSAFDDTITGSSGNNTIDGGDGNDILEGGAGNDVLNGGNNTDTVSYASSSSAVTVNLATTSAQNTVGAGSDTITNVENLIGSSYNDTLSGNTGANVINAGDGNDTVNMDSGNDTISGGNGNDTLSFSSLASSATFNLSTTSAQATGAGTDTISGFENIIGSGLADTFTGDSGDNTINGGAGDDIIEGGAGNDTLIGGSNIDRLSYALASSAITINLSVTIAQNTGGAGTDTISDFENLKGSAYNDTLTGNSGDNIIEGGAGNDTMNGDSGIDTASYISAASAVTVNLGTVMAQNTGGAGTDTLSNFENLIGSAFNDTLTGNSGDNIIEGGAGNDTLNGDSGSDTVSYASASAAVTVNLATTTLQNTVGAGSDTLSNFENLIGSGFNDTLIGNAGDNIIDGGAGNDTIEGGSGNDVISGGAGINTLTYSNASAGITIDLGLTTSQSTGGAGTDTISGFINLTGSIYADVLTGTSGANTITGGAGNDIIDGGAGNDILNGGNDIDTLSYASASSAVTVTLATTSAQSTGGSGTDTISNFENLTGSIYNDTLTGTITANVINGGAGNDTIHGNSGNDTLIFSDGTDVLYGDSGSDIFLFNALNTNSDTIADFSLAQSDKIDISDILQDYDPPTNVITDWVQITTSGSDSILSVDVDGGADNFVQIATITGVTGLTDEAALVTSGNLIVT